MKPIHFQIALHNLAHRLSGQARESLSTKILDRVPIPEVKSLLAYFSVLLLGTGTAFATFPGRNGLIAFQGQTDVGIQIFTVRPNGQELQQITHISGDAVTPDWSPDGRQIVFEHDVPDACGNVAIMNSDGSGLVELVSDPSVCEGDPSFTPDGARIVFDRFDPATNDEAFWSMDRNGNDRQSRRSTGHVT